MASASRFFVATDAATSPSKSASLVDVVEVLKGIVLAVLVMVGSVEEGVGADVVDSVLVLVVGDVMVDVVMVDEVIVDLFDVVVDMVEVVMVDVVLVDVVLVDVVVVVVLVTQVDVIVVASPEL